MSRVKGKAMVYNLCHQVEKTNRKSKSSHICKREDWQLTYYCKERYCQTKVKLHNRRNDVEITRISSEVPDKDLEDTLIRI